MKDFSKEKRNLTAFNKTEKIVGHPDDGMANKREEIKKIVEEEIKKADKLKRK